MTALLLQLAVRFIAFRQINRLLGIESRQGLNRLLGAESAQVHSSWPEQQARKRPFSESSAHTG